MDQIIEYTEMVRVVADISGLALGITSRDTVYLKQGFGVLGVDDERPVFYERL